MMADWTGIFVVVGVALLVFLLKYLIIKCYLTACRRNTDRNMEEANVEAVRDSMILGLGPYSSLFVGMRPVLVVNSSQFTPSSSTDFLEARHQSRLAVLRGRKPPPKFENALKCSTPVSFIQVPDNGPPPTYEEYLHMCRDSDETDLKTIIVVPKVHAPTPPPPPVAHNSSNSSILSPPS